MASETRSDASGASAADGSGHGIEVPESSSRETTSLLLEAGGAGVTSASPLSSAGGSSTVGSLPRPRDEEEENGGGALPPSGSTDGSGGDGTDDDDDELDRPWPATFGRTISILAGPHAGDADFLDKVTRSPKLTPQLVGRRGRRRFKSMKGSMTPEAGPTYAVASPAFRKGMAKYHSLDWQSKRPDAAEARKVEDKILERERKALEAKAYRQKILSKAGGGGGGEAADRPPPRRRGKDEEAALIHSPGYHREKQSDLIRKSTREEEEMKAKGGGGTRDASLMQCCFNMANILMGVGMLGLPFVFRSAGWIGGFFVTLSFGAVTWRTSILIGRELNGDARPTRMFDDDPFKSPTVPGSAPEARMRRPISTFPDIAREAFGENGCVCLSSVLYFELFSCLCIFFVTLGDHLHTLFPSVSETRHMCVVAIVLTLPTALLRTPRLLSYLSAVGTFATVAVVLAVVFSAVAEGDMTERLADRGSGAAAAEAGAPDGDGDGGGGGHHILWRSSGLPVAFGLIAYTFSGHAIVPSIYSSMARPRDFERMIDFTFLVVVSCCLLVAVSGYVMFGSLVEDQVTISLQKTATAGTELAVTMLTWLMILTAFSKFTLTMFPLAIGIEEIVAPFVPSDRVMEAAGSVIKLALIVLALAVAVFVPSFSFLCSLVGLVCTMIVSAIFPAAAHLKLFGPRLPLWERMLDWFFVVAGSVMAIVGTVATLNI